VLAAECGHEACFKFCGKKDAEMKSKRGRRGRSCVRNLGTVEMNGWSLRMGTSVLV